MWRKDDEHKRVRITFKGHHLSCWGSGNLVTTLLTLSPFIFVWAIIVATIPDHRLPTHPVDPVSSLASQ